MRLWIRLALAVSVSAFATDAYAQTKASFSRGTGGSIQTELGSGIVVNKGSTLQREWLTLHDPAAQVEIKDTVGVATTYVRDRISGHYEYTAKLRVVPSVDLAAIEVRFLTFDLWGDHGKTLVMNEIEDMPANVEHPLSGQWRVWSENEVSEHYASIAYVSRIRTKDGRVISTDPTPVIEEARKFSKKFTAADLEPKAPTGPAQQQ
jgi:hypothetical protein